MNTPPDSASCASSSFISSPRKRDRETNVMSTSSKATAGRQGIPSPASGSTPIAVGSLNEEERGTTAMNPEDLETSSVTSSVLEGVYENGLRYHAYKAGKYLFPNDEAEQERDHLKHEMTIKLCSGKHFYAPIDNMLTRGGEVLDLGTGTGEWMIEMGDMYPNTGFVGIDLSAIQPTYVAPNVKFFIDDMEHENGWTFSENSLDYIHIRHVMPGIKNRKQLLERIFRHLKPGGYVEFQEMHYDPVADDASLTPTTPYALRDFFIYLSRGMEAAIGVNSAGILQVPAELAAAGFEPVTIKKLKCPIGVWPADPRLRECGAFLKQAILEGLPGLSRKPLSQLGWTRTQIEVFLLEVRRDLNDLRFHSFIPFYDVYARKPLR